MNEPLGEELIIENSEFVKYVNPSYPIEILDGLLRFISNFELDQKILKEIKQKLKTFSINKFLGSIEDLDSFLKFFE